jgi:hypothetical protein
MPLLTLVGQAVATFAASFGVGYLPLAFDVISGKFKEVLRTTMSRSFIKGSCIDLARQTAQRYQRVRDGSACRGGFDYHYPRVSLTGSCEKVFFPRMTTD